MGSMALFVKVGENYVNKIKKNNKYITRNVLVIFKKETSLSIRLKMIEICVDNNLSALFIRYNNEDVSKKEISNLIVWFDYGQNFISSIYL